jgi:4-hydroxythreonine-4-phosphate dehydrogenase
MGEPAGIGGEISLLAWLNRDSTTPCYFVIDDPDRLAALARSLDLDVPVKTIDQPADATGVFPTALPVLAESIGVSIRPGQPNKKAAPAILRSIDRAIELVERGEAAAMVTNPIHKATLMAAGFEHPGHTEYLAERTGAVTAPVMMLACSQLRVVLTSIHLPLKDAVAQITSAAIMHAGEQGYLGQEEIDIVVPAIEQLQRDGLTVSGPFPADSMFHKAAREQYDAAICLYHDQALIPIKTIDFDGGVNITLGIPIVRTSPDHGTAFDIAGTGRASPRSLLAALTQARMMADHRTRFDAEHDSA